MLNVHVRITDSTTQQPTPARLRISTTEGIHFAPLGYAPEFPTGRNEAVGGQLALGGERWFYCDGTCEIALPHCVPLRVQLSKGPEFTPVDEQVTLGAGQLALRFQITRSIDRRVAGWTRLDSRCHFLSPHAAWLEAAAEDLDCVNLLAIPYLLLARDANTYRTSPNLLAFSGQQPALESRGHAVVVNTLNTHPVLGKIALLHSHRPVYPLTFGGEESDDWGICDWCDQCHRKGGLTVWVDAFESVAGLVGCEALVAAILGKIDAIEVTPAPRKTPLVPWLYHLWNAGFLVPLVGGSGKDSNKVVLGAMRTYVDTSRGHTWWEAIRAGSTFVTTGTRLLLQVDEHRCQVSVEPRLPTERVEVVINGAAQAIPPSQELSVPMSEPGWIAARCYSGNGSFAHTSPVRVGTPPRKAEAVAKLRTQIAEIMAWANNHGRYHTIRRREQLLMRCEEALARLESPE